MTTRQKSDLSFRLSRMLSVLTIKTHLKFRFVLFCLALLASAAVFSWLGSKLTIFQMIQEGLFTDDVLIHNLEIACNLIILINTAVLGVAFFFFLLVSHVITGPIFNMEKVFDRIRSGDISMEVRIRKGDDLQTTATKFNSALSALRTALAQERRAEADLLNELNRISRKLKENPDPAIANELEESLSHFKLAPKNIKID